MSLGAGINGEEQQGHIFFGDFIRRHLPLAGKRHHQRTDGKGMAVDRPSSEHLALISASGTANVEPALGMEPTEWDTVMDDNVRQSWLITCAAGKVMVEQAGGSLVLVSSVRARFATPARRRAWAACPKMGG